MVSRSQVPWPAKVEPPELAFLRCLHALLAKSRLSRENASMPASDIVSLLSPVIPAHQPYAGTCPVGDSATNWLHAVTK
jgi:hypothetical protein